MFPIRKLGAAVFGLAVLIGVPYLLLGHVSWPELPQSWGVALAHLRGWRTPPGVLPALLIVLLWALWALFAVASVFEAVARLRGVPLRLRPLGPLQIVVATAVATTAATPLAAFADTVADTTDEEVDQEGDDGERGSQDTAPSASEGEQRQTIERDRTISGFEVGSAELTEQMREDLAPTVEMLGQHWNESVPVDVIGHSDPSGSTVLNQELSEERAQAVADHLTEALGDNAPDMQVRGVSSDEPIEGPPESQRRVEVVYTLAPAPAPADDEPMEAEDVTSVENVAASESDGEGPRVVVLEVPDGTVTGALVFAGLAGGYVLGKRGSSVPRMALSLPRLTGRPRRLALTAPPPRPEPKPDIDVRVTVQLDHVPGLGITGAGSHGAARRLIVNALDQVEELAVRVLITETDTVRLMGEKGLDLLRARPCEPAVTVVPRTEDALAVLQSELHETERAPRVPLTMITSPTPTHESALAGLLLHGQHQGITAVVLGRWPLGGSCVVEEDGLITQTSTPLTALFHCSWPGSTDEEVHAAIHAHHHERPAEDRGDRLRSQEEQWERIRVPATTRPVLVPQDWDDDSAFVPLGETAPLGDAGSAWERLILAWDEEENEKREGRTSQATSAVVEEPGLAKAPADAEESRMDGVFAGTEESPWSDPASGDQEEASLDETPGGVEEPSTDEVSGSAAEREDERVDEVPDKAEPVPTGASSEAEGEPSVNEVFRAAFGAQPRVDEKSQGTDEVRDTETAHEEADPGPKELSQDVVERVRDEVPRLEPLPSRERDRPVYGPRGIAPVEGAPSPTVDGNAPERKATPARRERIPGRKAGRARLVRMKPSNISEPAETSDHTNFFSPRQSVVTSSSRGAAGARPGESGRAVPLRERRALRKRQEMVGETRLVEEPDGLTPVKGTEETPAYRPQPTKPRKAGRGRAWKPRDTA